MFKLRFLSCLVLFTLLSASFGASEPARAVTTTQAGGPVLRLQAGTFDPVVSQLPNPPGFGRALLSAQPGLALVQFSGPVLREWRAALEATGATIYAYVPDFAYLVRLNETQAAQAGQLAGVRWVGPYQPAYKLSATLSKATGPLDLSLEVAGDASLSQVEGQLGTLGVKTLGRPTATRRSDSLKGVQTLRVTADATALPGLAALDDVVWIAPASHPRSLNDMAAWNVQSGQPGQYPIWAQGITGAGPAPSITATVGTEQIVAVSDTGVYLAHQDFGSGIYPNANVLGITNWAYRVGYTNVMTGTDTYGSNGHGTHVAGTIAGSGAASSGRYKGMAYGARLWVQQDGPNLEFLQGADPAPSDPIIVLGNEARQKGAHIQNNSWGDGSPSGRIYGDYAAQADQFMWDNPDFLGLWSAGNDGSIYEPGTAKNVVTVGASLNSTNITDTNTLAYFSSYGPTPDGRTKPDVIAPGSYLTSVASNTTNGYFQDAGTSMSTPVVSGAAALLRDWYINRLGYATPQAALIKATLINSAQYMTPVGGNLPDQHQGWGRVQLSNVITTSRQVAYADEKGGLGTNEEAIFLYQVTNSAEPLKVSLAWTDRPGLPLASVELVNDLDLRLTAPDGVTSYQGNHFQGQFSLPGGSRDISNTVEGVTVQNPTPGWWQVRVRGYNVPGGPQPFGLVVRGALDCNLPTGLVTTASDGAATNCSRSFRQALTFAAPNSQIDLSRLPVGATVYPRSPLPSVPSGVSLNAPCVAGQPPVRLDGHYFSQNVPALAWPANGSPPTLSGLAIANFGGPPLDLPGSVSLSCLWLGTLNGQTAAPNRTGLIVGPDRHYIIGPRVRVFY